MNGARVTWHLGGRDQLVFGLARPSLMPLRLLLWTAETDYAAGDWSVNQCTWGQPLLAAPKQHTKLLDVYYTYITRTKLLLDVLLDGRVLLGSLSFDFLLIELGKEEERLMLQQMQTLAQKQVHCSSFVCYSFSSDWPSSIPGTFQPKKICFRLNYFWPPVLSSSVCLISLSTFFRNFCFFFSRFIAHEADPDRPIPDLLTWSIHASKFQIVQRLGRWADFLFFPKIEQWHN